MRSINRSTNPGSRLRAARHRFGWTLREVEAQSMRIAQQHQDRRFLIPHSRLNDLERSNSAPNIFRLYTLSRIYKRRIREILVWYGVPSR